ncbi:MAG: hypothetical protein B6U76_08250 [Desulfurococcales archaeon ex4484_217_2]|nr:MAG: hypothetical protein B6U76_08250 [Desulfurococcales archaeon ex4484_217_2]
MARINSSYEYSVYVGVRLARAGVKRVVIEVPESLRAPPGELEKRLRIELALRLYEKGIATLGQARRITGLPKWGFLELLAREGIPIHYGEEELREDLQVIRRFMEI